jgi:hypothetical protein
MEERMREGDEEENTERKRRTCSVEVSRRKSGQVGQECPETQEEEEAQVLWARDVWPRHEHCQIEPDQARSG